MAQKWFSTHNNKTHLIFYKKKTPKSNYNHRRRNRRNTAKFLMHNFFWCAYIFNNSNTTFGLWQFLGFSVLTSDPIFCSVFKVRPG